VHRYTFDQTIYARGKAQIVEKVLALASFLEKVIHVKFPNSLLTWILYMVRIELTLGESLNYVIVTLKRDVLTRAPQYR
jgi:hypothetical protein